jgi:hypothetical protein
MFPACSFFWEISPSAGHCFFTEGIIGCRQPAMERELSLRLFAKNFLPCGNICPNNYIGCPERIPHLLFYAV